MADEFQAKVDEVVQRYQPEIDQIAADGRRIEDEAGQPGSGELVIGIDFDVQWKDRSLSFNVPTVTMRNRDLSLDLPRIEKNRSRIVFDVPTVTMVRRCLFKKPEIHGTTIRMKCVYGNMPEMTMKKHEIIYDIPSVRMERKDFSLKIPEFGSKRREIIVKLPEFTAKNTRVEARKLESRGEELKARGDAVAARMEAEIQALIAAYFGGGSEDSVALRTDVEGDFNEAIGEVERSISELVARKVDPSKIPAEGGNINLRKVVAELIDQRTAVVAQIDQLAPAQ